MGLKSILKKLRIAEKEIRILVLGLEGSGKTTLVDSLINIHTDRKERDAHFTPSSTNGFEIKTLEFNEFSLHFWDIGGSDDNKQFWSNYYDSTNILIWAIDSFDVNKFEQSKAELEAVLQNQALLETPLLIVATKQDCEFHAAFPDFIRDLEINVGDRRWTAIASASQGIQRRKLKTELERGIEWIIDDFVTNTMNK